MNMPQNDNDGLPSNLNDMTRKELIEYAVSVGWNKDEIKGYGKNKLHQMLITETPPQQTKTEPTTLMPEVSANAAAKKVRVLSPMTIVFGAIRKARVGGKRIVTGFCSKLELTADWSRARSEKYIGVAVTPSGKKHTNKIYIVANLPNVDELKLTEAVTQALDANGHSYEVENFETGPVVTIK